MINDVYDHYEYLRSLTEKRFANGVLADEAHTFAWEKLSEDDWRRVLAYKGKSSFRSYLGVVWCHLLEDFSIKKTGKITPPKWIQRLGGVWLELFILLCRRRLPAEASIENIMTAERYLWCVEELAAVVDEILAEIPTCGQARGATSSIDSTEVPETGITGAYTEEMMPEELTLEKEKWVALRALAKVFFNTSENAPWDGEEIQELNELAAKVRERVPLKDEERLILTCRFVDGLSITEIGKLLGYNTNQIHGRFRRVMRKIEKTVPEILAAYL